MDAYGAAFTITRAKELRFSALINFLVTDYLLFIDTEASGLPKRWDVPYSSQGNWPNAVQIAWIICSNDGTEIKQENHYLNDEGFKIAHSATKVHGINSEVLKSRGESRREVLTLLANDLSFYRPLVIGHFMEFDFHITSAEFYRAGIDNPLSKLYSFCIMRATKYKVQNPAKKYLRLSDLYQQLFNTELKNEHDAIVDASATARCFFELMKRSELSVQRVEEQKIILKEITAKANQRGCSMVLFFFILILLITILYE